MESDTFQSLLKPRFVQSHSYLFPIRLGSLAVGTGVLGVPRTTVVVLRTIGVLVIIATVAEKVYLKPRHVKHPKLPHLFE